MTRYEERRLLAALLFGNFVVGTGVLLPAGMLTELARDLNVSVPAAGTLMLASGVVVAVGAPLAAAFTSAVDRRQLLVFSMALYAVCHVASALAPGFASLVAIRLLLAVSAAIFTPQAASTLGVLIPPERRAAAITLVFVGWSLATVGGMPLGGYVAHTIGWRAALGIVGAMSVLSIFAIVASVPRDVRVAPLGLQSWKSVLHSKALMTVLLVTFLNGTGQFSFFTYLAPSLAQSLAAGPGLVTLILVWYGTAATLGNIVVTRAVTRIGVRRAVFLTLLCMAVGTAVWGVGAGTIAGVLLGAALWGIGNFAANSVQQARLASIAPNLASASIALNTSAIYFGQALGAAIGGALIKGNLMQQLPYAASFVLFLAALVSRIAERWEASEPAAKT